MAQVIEKLDDPVWFWQKRYQDKCKELDTVTLEIEALQQAVKIDNRMSENSSAERGKNEETLLLCWNKELPGKSLESLHSDMLIKAVLQKLQTDIDKNVNENIYSFMSTLKQWVRIEELETSHIVEITQQIKQCYKHILKRKDNGWFKTAQSIVDLVLDLYYSYFCAIYHQQLSEKNTNKKEYKTKKKILVKDASFTLVYIGSENIMVRYCKFL